MEIVESDGSHQSADPNGGPVIYLYMPSKSTAEWYYIRKGVVRTPLSFDKENPDEFKRYYYLVESVETLAKKEL